MKYQKELNEINAAIRPYGLNAEFRNEGWQIYIKVRNGAINYYPSTDRWHTERRKLYDGKEYMLAYIVGNIERFRPIPQPQVQYKPVQKKGKVRAFFDWIKSILTK